MFTRTKVALSLAAVSLFPAAFSARCAEPPVAVAASAGQDMTWPRTIKDGTDTLVMYQPKIQKWSGTVITCQAAVSVTPPKGSPVYGVATLTARAEIDSTNRYVTIRDFDLTELSFPTEAKYETRTNGFEKLIPASARTVALRDLSSALAVSESVSGQVAALARGNVPRIFYSMTPAILVLVDGEPVLKQMTGLDAERVVNTRALIVKTGDTYYLYAQGYWYSAGAIEGPWTLATSIPNILKQVKNAAVAAQQVELFESAAAPEDNVAPTIRVSTVPAELIETDGPAEMSPVEGTNFLQVKNTNDIIFLNLKTNWHYARISGHWYGAKSLYGPWFAVSGRTLPSVLAKMPIASLTPPDEAPVTTFPPQPTAAPQPATPPPVVIPQATTPPPPPQPTVVYVQPAEPPPPPIEVIPVVPGPGYLWTGGYWNWGARGWIWVGGHWRGRASIGIGVGPFDFFLGGHGGRSHFRGHRR